MTTLSTFWTDVRSLLRDTKATSKYADELITGVLDRWIRSFWPRIVDRVPHYYFKESAEITGVDDALDAAFEQYTLPTDLRSAAALRRTDLTDKPALRYSGPVDQNRFRFFGSPYREPDSDEPTYSLDTWSFYGATVFRILPAPPSNDYTYKFEYWRKHTAATASGNTVDIPDEVYSLAVAAVALRCAGMQEPSNVGLIEGLSSMARMEAEMFQEQDRKKHKDVIPELTRFW